MPIKGLRFCVSMQCDSNFSWCIIWRDIRSVKSKIFKDLVDEMSWVNFLVFFQFERLESHWHCVWLWVSKFVKLWLVYSYQDGIRFYPYSRSSHQWYFVWSQLPWMSAATQDAYCLFHTCQACFCPQAFLWTFRTYSHRLTWWRLGHKNLEGLACQDYVIEGGFT